MMRYSPKSDIYIHDHTIHNMEKIETTPELRELPQDWFVFIERKQKKGNKLHKASCRHVMPPQGLQGPPYKNSTYYRINPDEVDPFKQDSDGYHRVKRCGVCFKSDDTLRWKAQGGMV